MGKPKVGGAIFVAPIGTALPTDAETPLDGAFKSLGYAGEDGLTNSNSPETEKIKAWGGDTVLAYTKDKPDTFAFKLLEGLNEDVLKTVYGEKNISGTVATGLTIKANSNEIEESSWVFEMILRGGIAKRVVIPSAKITEMGDIIYSEEDPVGYEVTITAFSDAEGNTHYEYLKGPAA